ncbi:MAG: alpha/beta hydrolase fold domain-containing protein [Verrucomicrobiales bacterium]
MNSLFNNFEALFVGCLLLLNSSIAANETKIIKGIEFAESLALDLYLPETDREEGKPPLIVYVHGGAWRSGSRDSVPIRAMTEHGFAIASVDYRLSPQAEFPANVHDIKAAIRFLRAKANDYGYNATRISIVGSSAGGHLAALVGVTNGNKELEGTVGDFLDQSSDVQAIVSFYGASNLTSILSQSTPHGLKVRTPALDLLLGGSPEEKVDLARLASPVFHVDRNDPPLLLVHGDQDPQMPINQSHELKGAYKKVGALVRFDVVHGGAHGGDKFYTDEQLKTVAEFLNKSR